MPICGFNAKMIQGIAQFSEGLFEATVAKADQKSQDPPAAVRNELAEIDLFLRELERRYGIPTDAAKKMVEMVYGIAVFADGLFKSALEKDGTGDFPKVFAAEVKRVCAFLEQLENEHYR